MNENANVHEKWTRMWRTSKVMGSYTQEKTKTKSEHRVEEETRIELPEL